MASELEVGKIVADSGIVGTGTAVVTTAKPTLAITDTSVGGSVTIRGQSPILSFDKEGSGTGTILTDGGGLNIKNGTLDSHGSTHLAIDSTGLASFSGGIAFSQTNSSATGATATGTTLDHYEEGTWTPAFSVGAISGSNITYTGRYTRIGKLVYIYCKIAATANDLVIGNYVGLSGLPFTAAASASGFSTTEDIDLDLGGEVNIGSTTIFFGATGSATSTQTITATLTYEV